jgi:hypothetical protein
MTKQEYFEYFCKEFHSWQSTFGLDKYDVRFKKGKIDSKNEVCYIVVDVPACCAVVKYGDNFKPANKEEVRRVAIHECTHLFLAELKYLAEERYASEKRIDAVVEGMCNTMEKIL